MEGNTENSRIALQMESVPAPDTGVLDDSIDYIHRSYDIPYYWTFAGGVVKRLGKRIVRKLLKCIIPPILERQSAINAHILNSLRQIKNHILQVWSEVAQNRQYVRELAEQVEVLRQRVEWNEKERSLEDRISELRCALDELRTDFEGAFITQSRNVETQMTTVRERMNQAEQDWSAVGQRMEQAAAQLDEMEEELRAAKAELAADTRTLEQMQKADEHTRKERSEQLGELRNRIDRMRRKSGK